MKANPPRHQYEGRTGVKTPEERQLKIDRLSGLEALLATYDMLNPYQRNEDPYVLNLKERVYAARSRLRQGL